MVEAPCRPDTALMDSLNSTGSCTSRNGNVGQRPAIFLRMAALAFAGRVVAQLVQRVVDVPWLPSYERWHSGALPYGVLLACQLAIVVGMMRVADAVARGHELVRSGRGRGLAVFGHLYLWAMVLRLFAGLTIASGHPWLDAPLPTTFHLLLAMFVIVWSASERSPSGSGQQRSTGSTVAGTPATRLASVVVYPTVTISACVTFVALDRAGLSPRAAALLTVIAAALVIVLIERALPYRRSWRPDRSMVVSDLVFMGAVQMALPAVMAVGFAFAARRAVGGWSGLHGLWPHDWPAVLQIVLMLLIADLGRYWLHRALHRSPVLWRLHAVHHAPDRLYTLNVGRFHPLEEMLRSVVETLPFVLMGVDDRVLAGYFVFFAVNGFFNHANVDVRLGALNRVIAGPELHRWHHSADVAESQHNYGSKLIVWDSLFGTRYHPADRQVARVGARPSGTTPGADDRGAPRLVPITKEVSA
jgi:ornithine lipid hydroxylase